jgi:transaldolase
MIVKNTELIINEFNNDISEEIKSENNLDSNEIIKRILTNKLDRARSNLIFHSDAESFSIKFQSILDEINKKHLKVSENERISFMLFLALICIDLMSFLPEWHLSKFLNKENINKYFNKSIALLEKLEKIHPLEMQKIIEEFRLFHSARLKAEGVKKETDIKKKIDLLIGDSITSFVVNIIKEINKSNLLKIAKSRSEFDFATEIGNDYPAFLQYAIWLGASFVTTNPVLIKIAWDINPNYWNIKIDQIIKLLYNKKDLEEFISKKNNKINIAIEKINRHITMAVVEENCLLLRDIFLLTGGSSGYVSLQVNPKNHSSPNKMVKEALYIYKELKKKLGGVPNIVFKLPATSGGKEAAKILTSRGIGVNITLTFSVFQGLEVAKVLNEGKAPVSFISFMNGRMAFPVRDELIRKKIKNGESCAQMAGVVVVRKLYKRLYSCNNKMGLCIDKKKVKLLTASLRVYGDYVPDISELCGIPVITVFPDIRRSFDTTDRILTFNSIDNLNPEDVLGVLLKSEIFRQAWWIPGDPEDLRPEMDLNLSSDDSKKIEKWEPVAKTLEQFISFYDQMGDIVIGRIKNMVDKTI